MYNIGLAIVLTYLFFVVTKNNFKFENVPIWEIFTAFFASFGFSQGLKIPNIIAKSKSNYKEIYSNYPGTDSMFKSRIVDKRNNKIVFFSYFLINQKTPIYIDKYGLNTKEEEVILSLNRGDVYRWEFIKKKRKLPLKKEDIDKMLYLTFKPN